MPDHSSTLTQRTTMPAPRRSAEDSATSESPFGLPGRVSAPPPEVGAPPDTTPPDTTPPDTTPPDGAPPARPGPRRARRRGAASRRRARTRPSGGPAARGTRGQGRGGKVRPRRSPPRTSTILIGVASALLGGLSLGLVVAFGIAREVHLMVDGEPIEVRTFAGTVAEVLAAAEVRYGPGDHVSPPPATPLANVGEIVVRHARPLTLIKDGRTTVRKVTALNVGDALEELDLDRDRTRLNASVLRQIPVSGLRLRVTTVRKIVIVQDGRRTRTSTTARTVREALDRAGIKVGEGERVRPKPSAFPKDGQVIRITPVPPPRTEAITPAVARLNWAALAACEAGGDPRAYNPAGPYYGLYQISLPMWQAVGGRKTPADWSADEQTYRAQLLYQRVEGRWQRQWPACGARLFS